MIKNVFFTVFLILLLIVNWVTNGMYIAVYPSPQKQYVLSKKIEKSFFIDKKEHGIHQAFLFGTPYERGYKYGELTKDLMLRQENELITILDEIFSFPFSQKIFISILARWFNGFDEFFESWAVDEMYGVSKHSTKKFDYLADGLTRQIAYHAIHEIGQIFVDYDKEDLGCTYIIIPYDNSFIVGRNFDFEAGRIFDEEKIMKWSFPDEGNAFLSIIWAGMVGVVSGVNENGLAISINAAGTDDHARYGTPTSIILLKALQFSNSMDDAIKIISESTQFISDIYLLADAKTHRIVKIEKSPSKFAVTELKSKEIITNHVQDKIWKDDSNNSRRKKELTTIKRYERGKMLLEKINYLDITSVDQAYDTLLSILRDKGDQLNIGNRSAIDPLIASHSFIYDLSSRSLFVSSGPALTGQYIGYNLEKSFSQKYPVKINSLPSDPLISAEFFYQYKKRFKNILNLSQLIKNKDCPSLTALKVNKINHVKYYTALGDYYFNCSKDIPNARKNWKIAISLNPAYEKIKNKLIKRLEQSL